MVLSTRCLTPHLPSPELLEDTGTYMAEPTSTDVMDPRNSVDSPQYWMSYALDYHMNPDEVIQPNIFRLTIILDRLLHQSYSKLRLVIVDPDPLDESHKVSIRATPWNTRAWGHKALQRSGTGPRKPLVQERRRPRCRSSIPNQGERCCTVVLLLKWYESHGEGRRAYHHIELLRREKFTDFSENRIILDKTYGRLDYEPSLFLLLESTHFFDFGYAYLPQRATIRVLPVSSSSRASFPPLPPSIQRKIIIEALEDLRDKLWAKSLLTFATIQKSWLHVLDLLYENVTDKDIAEPHVLFAALQKNITKASLLKSFNIMNANPYEHPGTGEEDGMTEEQLEELGRRLFDISFLRYGTQITSLTLNWDFLSLSLQEHVLKGLQSVEKFHITAWNSDEENGYAPMSMILNEIREWTKLKDFMVNRWGREDPANPPSLPSCSYQLQILNLSSGSAAHSSISHFVSHQRPTLTELHLTHVTTLNSNLNILFEATAPTLETIDISDCRIPAPKSLAEEEFALEAHIARMTRLKSVVIQGSCCSYLVLSRKTASVDNPKWANNTSIQIEDAQWSLFFRGQRDGKALMKEALETTGWKKIIIEPDRSENFWRSVVDRSVEDLAKRKGIVLMVEGAGGGGYRPGGFY